MHNAMISCYDGTVNGVSSSCVFELHALSSSSHSQGVVNIRWRHHGVCREVESSHQVMNINKRVEFGHFLRFNDVTADPHYPEKRVREI